MEERLAILLDEFTLRQQYSHEDWGIYGTFERLKTYPQVGVKSIFSTMNISSEMYSAVRKEYWTPELSASSEFVYKYLGPQYTARFIRLCSPVHTNDLSMTIDPTEFATTFVKACQPENLGLQVGMKFAYSYPQVMAEGLSAQQYYQETKKALYRKNKTFAGWFVRGLPYALKGGISIDEYEVALMTIYNEDKKKKQRKRELTKTFIFNLNNNCDGSGTCTAFAATIVDLGNKYDKKDVGWIVKTYSLLNRNDNNSDYDAEQFIADIEVLRKTRKYPEIPKNKKRNDHFGIAAVTVYSKGLRELLSERYRSNYGVVGEYREAFGRLVSDPNTTIQDLRYFISIYSFEKGYSEKAAKIIEFRSVVGNKVAQAFYWPMQNIDKYGFYADRFMNIVMKHYRQYGETQTMVDLKTTVGFVKVLRKLDLLRYFIFDRLITADEFEPRIQLYKEKKEHDIDE